MDSRVLSFFVFYENVWAENTEILVRHKKEYLKGKDGNSYGETKSPVNRFGDLQ